MNERIRELAEQVVGPSRLFGGEFALMGDKQVEQFARLIVQECLDQLLISDPTEDFDKGVAWSARQIKQHFGVEEEYRPPVQETHCPHDILLDKYCKKCDDEVSNQLGKLK